MSDTTISIVIPAYNEEHAIDAVLPELDKLRDEKGWEVIIVNDGSTDGTTAKVEAYPNIRLINQENLGYGGALKRGFREANGEYIVTLDADGQHDPQQIPELVEAAKGKDLVTGVRGGDSHRPLNRRPGKWVLTQFAQHIGGREIQDINCGFRIYRKKILMEMMHLFPNGFSLSTTSMVGFLKGGYEVGYIPVKVAPRKGRSSNVNYIKDGLRTVFIILRISMLFDPMRVFLPLSILFFAFSIILGSTEIFMESSFPTVGTIGFMISVLVFLLGLIADMVSLINQGFKDS